MPDSPPRITVCRRIRGRGVATTPLDRQSAARRPIIANRRRSHMPGATSSWRIVMTRNNGPSGPYFVPPPPPPPPPLALYIPDTALADATDEQRAKIALIELEFAQKVSVLLSKTYSEITALLRDTVRKE